MRRSRLFLPWIFVLLMLAGCSIKKMNTKELRKIEFTVVEEDEIPEELAQMIEEKRESPFKVTYSDGRGLYIAQGYGQKETSGYSVNVDECYETANAVYVHTNLLGPGSKEQIVEADTYPYVVIKIEMIDKHVVFK